MTVTIGGRQHSEDIAPFTYFRDTRGVISYYLGTGMTPLSDGRVRAIAVYLPVDGDRPAASPRDAPVSVDPRDGSLFTKTAYQGRTYEHTQASSVASDDVLAWLEDNTVADLGGMAFGVLPDDIVEIFDGREALQRLLDDPGQDTSPFAVQPEILAALRMAADTLERSGIDPETLRLYGSLACGIRRIRGGVTDVDMVVDDDSARVGIASVCAGNQVVESKIQGWLRQDAKRFSNAVRRGQTSQFHVDAGHGDPIQVDIRVGTSSPSSGIYRRLEPSPVAGARITSSGTIADDSGTLSFPPTFVVACIDGVIRKVCSDYYQWIGAATCGDRVRFRGTLLDPHTVLLGDTPVDYLVTGRRDQLRSRSSESGGLHVAASSGPALGAKEPEVAHTRQVSR